MIYDTETDRLHAERVIKKYKNMITHLIKANIIHIRFNEMRENQNMPKSKTILIAGPDVVRHVDYHKGDDIYIYENNVFIHQHMAEELSNSKYKNNKKVILLPPADVFVSQNTAPIIDLDIMSHICTVRDDITKMFKNQIDVIDKQTPKAFSFTVTTRGKLNVKKQVVLDFITELIYQHLGERINIYPTPKNIVKRNSNSRSYCKDYIIAFNSKSRLKDIAIFSYKDTQSMITCHIIYK